MAAYILYYAWRGVSLQCLYLEPLDTKGIGNELCNEKERFMKSLLVGEGLQLGTIKEKLAIFVSWRHFRTLELMRTWVETERGTCQRQKAAWKGASKQ